MLGFPAVWHTQQLLLRCTYVQTHDKIICTPICCNKHSCSDVHIYCVLNVLHINMLYKIKCIKSLYTYQRIYFPEHMYYVRIHGNFLCTILSCTKVTSSFTEAMWKICCTSKYTLYNNMGTLKYNHICYTIKKNRVTGTRYLLHQQSISNITILNMKKTSILLRKLFKFMLFHALSNEKINASVKIEFLLKV